jgi:D-sedoheptulose 7-phosphate isomerase
MNAATLESSLQTAFGRRVAAGRALADDASLVTAACEAMAERFRRGGTLLVFGGGAGAADAAHVAVEFVHPVIVGKRALPAMSLAGDAATITGLAAADPTEMFARPLGVLARPNDIALALAARGDDPAILQALRVACERGLLTLALVGYQASPLTDWMREGRLDHLLQVRSDDPCVIKEVQVTTYHVLWELVHVFLDAPSDPPS